MRYIDEMQDKYGFSDGGSTPPDAWKLRTIYCFVINSIAKQLGSNVRILPFDRSGMHNGCMVLYAKATEQLKKDLGEDRKPQRGNSIKKLLSMAESRDYRDKDDTEADPDDAMLEAMEIASDLEPDQFVDTKVIVDNTSLRQALREALKQKKG